MIHGHLAHHAPETAARPHCHASGVGGGGGIDGVGAVGGGVVGGGNGVGGDGGKVAMYSGR